MENSNRYLSETYIGKNTAVKLRDAALLSILDSTSDMMFIKDVHGVYIAASMPFVKRVGKTSLEEVIGQSDFDIFEDKRLAELHVADDKRLIEGGVDLIDHLEPLPSEDGRIRYGATSKHILYDEEGRMVGMLGITRDITKDHLARQYYHNEMTGIFNLSDDVYHVILIDIDDWSVAEQRRQSIDDVMMPKHYTVESLLEEAKGAIVQGQGDSEAIVFYQNFNQAFLIDLYDSGTSQLSLEYLRCMPGGSYRWVKLNAKFIVDPETGHTCIMLTLHDIDAERKEKLALVNSAKIDRTTLLFNRETTMEKIDKCLKAEPDLCHTLLMIDVDNFKTLNLTKGHQEGDYFLLALAKELRGFFRESDIIGRVGGDEFFVLMRNTDSLIYVENRIKGLLATAREVCSAYPGTVLSVSIGVSQYPKDGKTSGELYAASGKALYKAKSTGKNRFCFVQNELD